jgi:hypothetical protein
MSSNANADLFGCSGLVGLGYLALYILSVVYYADYVVPYDGSGSDSYEYILSWLYKMGIYSIVSLSFYALTLIMSCVSCCINSILPIGIYMFIYTIANFCVMSWLLAEGIYVNDGTYCYVNSDNLTVFTKECLLYKEQFNVLFVFFCVMYGFSALTTLFFLCFGIFGLCGICRD